MRKSHKGFTLIELLVVIAIIGLLSTLAVVALNSARQRSRDAKRVADIRQIQTALELAFSETNDYPTGTDVELGTDVSVLCNDGTPGTSTFETAAANCDSTVFMGLVPSAPTPPTDDAYTFNGDGNSYSITFELEGATGQLSAGSNCANADGITAGSTC